ncbi:MAG: ABC transporter substrate-binding protein, partial [Alphaproteobacteria bacterium]
MAGYARRIIRSIMAASAGLAALAGACGGSLAAVPRDVFVMAMQIDDVISLDPAELFEFTGAEVAANIYDRLLYFDLDDPTRIVGGVAQSWSVSPDGRTYTFRIRPGMRFPSGNPVTARDAAYSLRRVVRLNLSPGFIVRQFGLDEANAQTSITAGDDRTLSITTDRAYAPSFFLACLTAAVGSVVDGAVVASHEVDGDMGHRWLKTHSAGSGPFMLAAWKPNEIIVLDRFDGYWRGAPAMRKVMIRHIAEPGIQRLLVERGDIDVARNLGPDQAAGVGNNPELRVRRTRKGALYYLGLNQKNEYLRRPEVREAVRYLVDYRGIAGTLMRGAAEIHQAFVPLGYLGALADRPFRLDTLRARHLLEQAGLGQGFAVTLDVRGTRPDLDVAQSLQSTFAAAGIRLDIAPADGRQVLTK